MPGKPPKKVPVWMDKFVAFVKKTDKDNTDLHAALDMVSQSLTHHWTAFVEQETVQQEEKPKKVRKTDPIKNLGKALDKVADRVEEADGDDNLLKQYKEKVSKVVPQKMRPMFSEFGASGNPELVNLVKKTSKTMRQLKALAKKLAQHAQQLKAQDLISDAQNAMETIDQVTENIDQMETVVSS